MWRAMAQQRVPQTIDVGTGLAERAVWSFYPTGLNLLSHYAAELPRNKVNDWLKAAMAKRNQVPDIFHTDGFAAAQMIVRAVQKSGGDDVERMIRGLEGWQFVTPKGIQRIRPQDHAMLQPMFHARLATRGGKLVAVPVKTFSPGNVQPPILRSFDD